MNAPGAIFADEGVIIFALEKAYPITLEGGWAAKKAAEAAANAAAEALKDEENA